VTWQLATSFQVSNSISDQWFLLDHLFTSNYLIVHIESDEIPETWEFVGYAMPSYSMNLAGTTIDGKYVISGNERDNRYTLFPLVPQEIIIPTSSQAYKLYFRFVRYMRNAVISIYENTDGYQIASNNNGGGIVPIPIWNGTQLSWDLDGDGIADTNPVDLRGATGPEGSPGPVWVLDQLITSWSMPSRIDIPHGLGVIPSLVRVTFVAVQANNGYSIGDETESQMVFGSDFFGFLPFFDSTNIYLRFTTSGVHIAAKDAQSFISISPSQWNIRVRAV
jgi:hypothetical protein